MEFMINYFTLLFSARRPELLLGPVSIAKVALRATFAMSVTVWLSVGYDPLVGAAAGAGYTSIEPAVSQREGRQQPGQNPTGQDPVRPSPNEQPREKPPAPSPSPTPPTESGQPGEAKQIRTDRQADLDVESIRIDSTLVVVPVSVTDQSGQPIRDLEGEDFILEEEGVKQQIQLLGDPGKIPIELGLLFDVSRSVRNRFDFEKTAAAKFLEVVLKEGDQASLFLIGRSSHMAIERTGSAESVIAAVLAIEPTDEATAFFDTVVSAARYVEENAATGARRVLVVISDGEDNNSEKFLLRDALVEAQGRNCLF